MVIQLIVMGKRKFLMDVCENKEELKKVTVLELKKKIRDKEGLSEDTDLRLVFTTEPLEDPVVLSEYGIQHMSTIHIVMRQPGGQQQLNLILPSRSRKVLDLCESAEQMNNMTVKEVKQKITDQHWIGGGVDLRLVFRTQMLEDMQPLSSYGIKHMSTVHTLARLPGGRS